MTDPFDLDASAFDPKSRAADMKARTHLEFLRNLPIKRELRPHPSAYGMTDVSKDAKSGKPHDHLHAEYSIHPAYPLDNVTSGDGQKPHLNLSMPNPNTERNWLARKLKNFAENLSGFLLSLEWPVHRGFGGKGSKLPVFPYAGSGDRRPDNVNENSKDKANPNKNAEKKKEEDADANKNADPKENPKETPEGKKSKRAKKRKHQKVNPNKNQGGGES